MVLIRGSLGVGVPLSFDALYVKQDGLGVGYVVPNILKDGNEVIKIMSIHRSDVIEAEFLKESASCCHASNIFIKSSIQILDIVRHEGIESYKKIQMMPVQ